MGTNAAVKLNGKNSLPATGEKILSGELADISLPTLLHLLEIENVTGWLLLDRRARIDFAKGHVIAASIGSRHGVEALREILFQEGSRFEVCRGEPRPEQGIERVAFAVMDAFRLRDEWARIEGSVLRLVGGQMWRPTGTEVDALMDRIDGESSLRELVALTGVPVTMAIECVLDALTLGLVEVVKVRPKAERAEPSPATPIPEAARASEPGPAPAPAASPAPAPAEVVTRALEIEGVDFYELLDRARASMRRGALDEAEALVEAALRLRPEDRVARQNLRRIHQLRG
ncbi:MAG: DUF4388 domain-containing protein [Myxococcales bacterium]|nr:DUF4388 domain-containing protein [Myxococcales bacterium]MCB9705429.1 DUF4388 domain-containing protein [Myxococcales bacterium]